jgi:hypothetical protein
MGHCEPLLKVRFGTRSTLSTFFAKRKDQFTMKELVEEYTNPTTHQHLTKKV